jgi:trigger factor
MSVVVSVEDLGSCRKQLTVEVPAPAVEAETQRVVREYGQKARLPGFRQGKVPTDLVRRRFAKDIDQEVKERLLPRYWKQAQAESSIDPLLPPEVDEVSDLIPGEPLTFLATVETRPEIALGNTRDFDLPDPEVDPGTLEIEETIENIRKQMADWVTVDRPAARGDRARLEVTALGSPEHPEEHTDPVQVEIGDPQVWPELSEALRGLSTGEEATFERRHEHPAEEEGAAPVVHEQKFRARINEIQERDLAPLDDAFAARVNPEIKSFEALREMVVQRLRQQKEEARREARHEALLDQLRERHPIDLPQGVVRREVEGMVQEYAESLSRRGVDVEKAPLDWNRVGEDMMPLAEKRVHARLLLDAVAEEQGIAVTEEEFERTLAMLARSQGVSTPGLRRKLDEEGRLAPLRTQLRREKTIRTLLGEATETPGAAPELITAGQGD